MLTRNDATVENALDLVEIARALGLRHIGFKDVGAEASMLRRLTTAIREAGASPWMEVVATMREAELRSIALARDLGVDLLMGGVHVEEGLRILEGSATRICPSPASRAAIRRGSAAPRRRSRRNAGPSRQKAARASTFSPIARPKPSRSISSPPVVGLNGRVVVVAGSVNSAERVSAIRAAGADASHWHGGDRRVLRAGAGPLAAQLRAVLEDRAAG